MTARLPAAPILGQAPVDVVGQTGQLRRRVELGSDMTSVDFFISYTAADEAWVTWIARTLERAGYSTVFQKWDFRPGENFLERMDQALTNAQRVLAVMSPAYFHSYYARKEWMSTLGDRYHDDRLLPVRVARVQPPPLLAKLIYIDLVDVQEGTAAERLLAGVQSGRVPSGRSLFPGLDSSRSGAMTPFPGRHPAVFNVPPRNPNFTGRRVDDHVIPQACAHVIPQVLAYACFT